MFRQKGLDSHTHNEREGFDSSSEAALEAKIKAGIVSTNMQDYLSQISELEEDEGEPSIAIPGQWLTDQKKAFLFLPIKVPKDTPLDDLKLLTNGRQLLLNLVERTAEMPDDEATKKFRLVLGAFKSEANGDVAVFSQKLGEWYQEEESNEVKALIKETIDGLESDKQPHMPRSIDIPLNTLELGSLRQLIAGSHEEQKVQQDKYANQIRIANPKGGVATIKLKGTYLQKSQVTKDVPAYGSTTGADAGLGPNLITVPLDAEFLQRLVSKADYVVPLKQQEQKKSTNIKESFSVTIPYPVMPGRVFAVLAQNGEVVVTMPYQPEAALAPSSDPFVRVPVFDMNGDRLVGGPGGKTEATLDPESSKKEVVMSPKNAVAAPDKKEEQAEGKKSEAKAEDKLSHSIGKQMAKEMKATSAVAVAKVSANKEFPAPAKKVKEKKASATSVMKEKAKKPSKK